MIYNAFFIILVQNLSSVNAASEEDLNSIVTHEDDSSLLTSVRSRHKQTIEPGSLNVLSAKYEVFII